MKTRLRIFGGLPEKTHLPEATASIVPHLGGGSLSAFLPIGLHGCPSRGSGRSLGSWRLRGTTPAARGNPRSAAKSPRATGFRRPGRIGRKGGRRAALPALPEASGGETRNRDRPVPRPSEAGPLWNGAEQVAPDLGAAAHAYWETPALAEVSASLTRDACADPGRSFDQGRRPQPTEDTAPR